MTSPAQDKPYIIGQAIVSSMNGKLLGIDAATITDVNALKAAALGSPNNFLSSVASNKAWLSVSGTYQLTQSDVRAFFSRFDLQDVVNDRGLNAIRAYDTFSNKQTVFVAGAAFPNEFLGVGVSESSKYGGSVVQGKALTDAYVRWSGEGINMANSNAVCNSLGGSTLAMAMPNLNYQLNEVVCFGGYGLNDVALNQPTLLMASKYGLPEGFADYASFNAFISNVKNNVNIFNSNITNYVLGDDWIPTFQIKPFGTLVSLTSPYPSADGLFGRIGKGLSKDHILTGYWKGIDSVANNSSPEGLTFTVTAWTKGLIYVYSNGVTYTNNVADNEKIWVYPSNTPGMQVIVKQSNGTYSQIEAPTSNPTAQINSVTIKPITQNRNLVIESSNVSAQATFVVEDYSLGDLGVTATEATNTVTNVSTYTFKDASGIVWSGGANYSVSRNNTLVITSPTGTREVYEKVTTETGSKLRFMATISVDGSGLVVESNGNETFFNSGELSLDTNSGILTATVGGQISQYFGTTNFVDIASTTTGAAAGENITDGTFAFNTTLNRLLSDANYTVSIGNFWDVNTAAGNQAVAGYAVTEGFRPGNNGIGLNINASSGIGLQIPGMPPPANTNPAVGPVDYSLYGSSINNAAQSNFFQVPVDPLVLDLNGDGVKLTNFTDAPVLFDADNDGGSLEQTGWVSSQDGIVVHDLNNDGKINNISETLSEYYNGVAGSNGVAGTKPFANGFAALKSLDSNNDNQFTSLDAAWSQLKVWTDSNHDGKTDAGELKTFAQLGITAINLNSTSQSGEVRDGNAVLARGTFTQNALTREAIAANFIASLQVAPSPKAATASQ